MVLTLKRQYLCRYPVKVTRTPRASDQPQHFKIRLPFPRPAAQKDVKKIILEMTQAASIWLSEGFVGTLIAFKLRRLLFL
mmetsp:Transcript_24874/g.38465  ORF Transcript_24874/g.38465 Transcript_24874/m.38465 type:complete len:80 (+) Transcript_24874:141-380(+)